MLLEQQIESQESKDSGWRSDKINSLTIYFYKTTDLKRSSYVRVPSRSSAIINIENDDKLCFLWSLLARLQPIAHSKNNYKAKVSSYSQFFDELNIHGFVFTNGY